jgi:tRNA A37 threonylcarbamoyladenosine dehydratase
MAVPYWLSRMSLMLPEAQIEKLMNANVLVVGLGGVGGICAEMIARAGVGKMTIVDADTVDASNKNRQIPALTSTEGLNKVEVMAARIRDINPAIQLRVLNEFVKDDRTDEILTEEQFDYAVDCIDTLSPKVFFIKACLDKKIPIVSSMGAGGKVDPSQIKVVDISKTYNCPFAQQIRKNLKNKFNIRRGITVVFSPEQPIEESLMLTDGKNYKKSAYGTISYLPAVFGAVTASVVIRDLMK